MSVIQVMSSFNNYAPTKSAYIFKDSYSKLSRGYGVVEFESVPGATQVIGMASLLSVHGYHVLLGFANPYCIRSSFPRLLT